MKNVSTTTLFLVFLLLMGACGDDEEKNSNNNSDIAVTGSCIEVGGNHARIEGYFNSNNVTASTSSLKVGIEYSSDQSLKNSKFVQSNIIEGNRFEVNIQGLKVSSQYFYRTCVIANSLHYVGKISSFTTDQTSEKEFPDYEGNTTAYFAYQNPVRTLVLGNDIYDNSLDNAHRCRIWATMGGAYSGRDAVVDYVVDESLCDHLWFVDEGGNPSYTVTPMPTAYYLMKTIVISTSIRL